jgi:hypothetical protein
MAGARRRLVPVAATIAATLILSGCASGTVGAGASSVATGSPPAVVASTQIATPLVAASTPRPTPAPRPVAPSAVAADQSQQSSASAQTVLAALPVKGRAATTGYARSQFGSAWNDDTQVPGGHNGCDTRNDILRRDLHQVLIKSGTNGCVVASGELLDPYTGHSIAFTRGADSSVVQIDHVVALSDAWQTGAQRLTATQRQQLANDPLELLAVDGPSNQQKGNGDAATWLPSNKRYRCAYVARQVAVKQTYHLWVTGPERDAIARVLRACPDETVPHEVGQPKISLAVRAPTPRTSTPVVVPAPTRTTAARTGCTTTASGSCIRGGQFCPKAKYGQSGYDANGTRYVCSGDATHPHWQTP